TGPEVLAGSTRLAAGTAQKIAPGALSTTVLAQLGGAYGNLMVGMKPGNLKLRNRAAGIVAMATGVDPEHARERLEQCDWEMRTAIVTLETGAGVDEARELLARAGNSVRRA